MKKIIKKWLNLFDENDFDRANLQVGFAGDREEYIWKLKKKLFKEKK